jgi:hypothetical protein
MKTISAKDLRTNLDQILDKVANGEEILVSHRLKKHPIRLSAVYTTGKGDSKEKFSGLKTFDSAPKKPSPYNPDSSLKELYRQSISEKYLIR